MLVSTLRKIHLLATRPFGTVQVLVAVHASITTVVCAWDARYLDIYTTFTSLPTSCTTGVAIQCNSPRRHEASCEKQAEGYTAYLHYGAINFSLTVNVLSPRVFAVLTRLEWVVLVRFTVSSPLTPL